jgi:hypothetical protein
MGHAALLGIDEKWPFRASNSKKDGVLHSVLLGEEDLLESG